MSSLRPMLFLLLRLATCLHIVFGNALPPFLQQNGRAVSQEVFESLEELARVVDISYCVGTTGIQKPFRCLSRCSDFEGFELITTWNTGPLLSDSCGYIALSHAPHKKRVIVAFRGTYSLANTIADLSTNPAEYAPFPASGDGDMCTEVVPSTRPGRILPQLLHGRGKRSVSTEKCDNCTVHSGFMSSWRNTRCTIIPHVEKALNDYPEYQLTLVGHSLGGAVAALAGLEFQARGWSPIITTFGEPQIGNYELNRFIDRRFNLQAASADDAVYRRVTHVDDPVPLLPPQQWGYRMHAGEIFISKASLPPTREDVEHCDGGEDPQCIGGGETLHDSELVANVLAADLQVDKQHPIHEAWSIPRRYRLWQLFFAHRDYFWRLGLCLPSYSWDWHRNNFTGIINTATDDEL